MQIRSTVPEDRQAIQAILHGTESFTEREIEIALEVFDIHFGDPEEDYELYTCVDDGNVVLGYVCIGPTPLTEGTWDLYWIAIGPAAQGKGVGKRLTEFIEERIRSARGRLIVAETSSTGAYDRARKFYLRNGFREIATLHDYYRTGDHMFIYGKYL